MTTRMTTLMLFIVQMLFQWINVLPFKLTSRTCLSVVLSRLFTAVFVLSCKKETIIFS